MKQVLTSLWIIGAVLYLISTLLFTNAINLVGNDEPRVGQQQQAKHQDESRAAPDRSLAQPVPKKSAQQDSPQLDPTHQAEDRLHAISPDQPSSDSRVAEDSLQVEQKQSVAAAPPQPMEEVLTVTWPASIRNGPSASAEVIGTAHAGAELHVTARNAGWVQFTDPVSGNTGWISSAVLIASNVGTHEGPPAVEVTREIGRAHV